MVSLAILGHKTRGKEVIEILEMLGGINSAHFNGDGTAVSYYIELDNSICIIDNNVNYNTVFHKITLEEFLEKFPYKVGDKVRCWINGYCSIDNIKDIQWDSITNEIKYKIQDYWYSTMNLQPYKEETMETITIDDFKANTKEWLIDKLGNMSMEDALQTISSIYNELHKPKYPKTYEECCEILGIDVSRTIKHEDLPFYKDVTCYENNLLSSLAVLRKLRICRDAYWKIAGNEMGLGKPWEPDCDSPVFVICRNNGKLSCDNLILGETDILEFPTAEMRGAFYENFKDLTEQCKELL